MMRVLIADDEPLELEQLEWMIHRFDPLWEVRRASDGEEALKSIADEAFDLVLLDINMPGIDGLEVAAKTRERYPDLPIIMVTARTDFASTQQALRIGVTDYLGKPLIERELLEVLEKHGRLRNRPKSNMIYKVQQLVQERFNQRISLVELAGEVHVHPAYLSRKFHEDAGIPLSDYINRYRLEQACEFLLHDPDRTIAEVAREVGFTSQHYFSTQFRRHTGQSSSQYREKKDNK